MNEYYCLLVTVISFYTMHFLCEAKNKWICVLAPHLCLHDTHRGNFNCTSLAEPLGVDCTKCTAL